MAELLDNGLWGRWLASTGHLRQSQCDEEPQTSCPHIPILALELQWGLPRHPIAHGGAPRPPFQFSTVVFDVSHFGFPPAACCSPVACRIFSRPWEAEIELGDPVVRPRDDHL